MTNGPVTTSKKWPVKRTILISVIVILALAGIFFYQNFNRLLSDALLKSFNSSVISDVYELKFEKLRANLFEGSIKVYNVSFIPREKPLQDYPYINSSFQFTTDKISLERVDLQTLLSLNKLILEKILIAKPDVKVTLNGKRHIMLPFAETTEVKSTDGEKKKRPLSSFTLKEFKLTDARVHTSNSGMQREFNVNNFSIILHELTLNQQPGKYQTSVKGAALSIETFSGHLKKGALKSIGFNDFRIGIDSIAVQLTMDTLIYRFHDFNTEVHDLDIQTRDSIFHIGMKSFDLSYKNQSVKLKDVSFKPNLSHAAIQKNYKYQHTEFSVSVGKLDLKAVDFDSLIYGQKLFVSEVEMEEVKAAIFKDKTKPMDSTRYPVYLAQTIRTIKMPLRIHKLGAKKVELENTERKPDSTLATVKISKAKVEVENITNLAPKEKLVMRTNAFINDKVQFYTTLAFSYSKPQFSFEGKIGKFNLPDLNPLIQAYTPAKINEGIADEISFSGMAEEKTASGTMKFLYHNLNVDLELKQQAKWKSDLIAFAANTALNANNPVSPGSAPRIVKFQTARDMNKGFVNVIIRSVLNGLKETMIMSKENRKTHKEAKKEIRQENKK